MTQPHSASAQLPSRPSLNLLSNLADALRKSHASRDPQAIARLKASHPRFASAPPEKIAATEISLRDAQLVIAREYGFEHWAALKTHVTSLLAESTSKAAIEPLLDAAGKGDVAAVAKILDAHENIINARGGKNTQTAMHLAAQHGHLEVVRLLLDRGGDPTVRDVDDNATPLHFAAEQGSLEIVKLMVERGADFNGFGDVHNWDVIGWATLHHETHTDVANYLLTNGAQHNIFTAVAMGDVEAIKSLAANSRDVLDKPMAIWEARRRPLHLAAIKKQPASAMALLDLGADIEATNVEGLTALDEAALRNEPDICRIFIERGAKIHVPAAFGLRRSDDIDRLLREEPNAVQPGGTWQALLDFAASNSPADVIENLICHGASVNSRADSKAFGTKTFTPLHSAAWTGNLAAIETLIRHGADLDARDATHHATPLGWATFARRTEAAQLLRAHGATE